MSFYDRATGRWWSDGTQEVVLGNGFARMPADIVQLGMTQPFYERSGDTILSTQSSQTPFQSDLGNRPNGNYNMANGNDPIGDNAKFARGFGSAAPTLPPGNPVGGSMFLRSNKPVLKVPYDPFAPQRRITPQVIRAPATVNMAMGSGVKVGPLKASKQLQSII